MLGRYSPGGAVKIDLPAPFTGDGSQSFLSWARQLEVAVGATAGGGHGCTEELAKCLEMGATDLEEALHVAERCENARMTLQRDCIRLGCPPGRLGVEALARTGVPDVRTSPGDVRTSPGDVRTSPGDVRTSPGDVRTSPGDVRTNPGDAACTSCHDSRMLTTAIRETAGRWCRGPNASYSYGPVSLEESPVTAEQRAKLAELLQRFTDVFNLGDRNTGRDGLQPDPRNTDKTLSSQMLLQPGFAPWPQWRCLTTLRLQTGHKQSQFRCIHLVVVELNCGQHSVKTLTLVLCCLGWSRAECGGLVDSPGVPLPA
ncbi:unnamed protein product [Gadus morhua 'NCC']